MSESTTAVGKSPKTKKKIKVKVFSKKKKGEPETVVVEKLHEQYQQIDPNNVLTFTDFPLSPKTLKGLKECGYTTPTDVQRLTIGLSLQNKDILGAAQTGSGKTLAFLIPILEVLFCKRWTTLDGVGALVITPTRELAYQIFETLRKVGKYHDVSAGLIIGGKDLKFERKRMDQCNVIICTPGRLLQHMDENPLFDCVNMQILVLDEADRCLDMGFEHTMNAIIANLPPKRQTLLFSATQTKSVKDLARLSLKDPSYVSVHENSQYSTPCGLEQSYTICELQDKVAVIWSFIRNHKNKKIIIFFSSCKQVKYIYEIFCKLRPGTSIMALYGTLHQMRRMTVYETFCSKKSAVLFATDIAARGLDFPEVHWVVQADCPEDTDTYIHRVGRTARYHRGGESILLLLPSEESIVDELEQRRIPLKRIEVNPSKMQNPVRKMEAFLAKDHTLKESAQRAFVSYVKSVFLMKNKAIFNVHALDTNSYSQSLGLAIPPRIRFLQKLNAKTTPKQQPVQKTINKKISFDFKSSDEETDDERDNNKVPPLQEENLPKDFSDDENEPAVKHSEHTPFQLADDSDSDEGILTVKRTDHEIELPTAKELEQNSITKTSKKKAVTKAALVKKLLRKKIAPNKKTIFNDEGEAVILGTKEKRSELAQHYEIENEGGIDIERAKLILKEEDVYDKQLFKAKVKAKHKEQKRKLKEKKKAEEEEERDDFGSESEGDEPDLSWLPDPDKVYGKKGDNDVEDEEQIDKESRDFNSEEESEDHPKVHRAKKRKVKLKKPKGNQQPVKKKRRMDLSEDLSVNDAEQLAMMLLKN